MQNHCPSPGCDAVYNLSSDHIGRSFTCKKCGSALVVGANGLELTGTTPQVPSDPLGGFDQPPPSPRRYRGTGGGAFFSGLGESLKADAANWVLGFGLFLVIIFVFFPVIDAAKVSRLNAKVDAGDARLARMRRQLQRDKDEDKSDNKDEKYKGRQEEIDKAEKEWKKKKVELEEDAHDAGISRRTSRYWYLWGLMLGFLLLAFAGMGFLRPSQSITRRVVGAVIICGVVLVIYLAFVTASPLIQAAPEIEKFQRGGSGIPIP